MQAKPFETLVTLQLPIMHAAPSRRLTYVFAQAGRYDVSNDALLLKRSITTPPVDDLVIVTMRDDMDEIA